MIDSLGDRMKSYEEIERRFLTPRTPIILRLDGRAFHTYTQGLDQPFDNEFRMAMDYLKTCLMHKIQGAFIGYSQSDEISLFLHTWSKFDTNIWFGGNIQKMVSIAASEATLLFNTEYHHPDERKLATFDARVFTLPKEEVTNYFRWRHSDAMRNAISAYAEYLHGSKACHGVKTGDKLNMIPPEVWQKVKLEHKFGQFSFAPITSGLTGTTTGKFDEVSQRIEELVNYQLET